MVSREPVGREQMSGGPIEHAAAVLRLAASLSGKALVNSDIEDQLKRQGTPVTHDNVTAVQEALG